MSDPNIPFEIQTEIIKKLPVKPLVQFRSVSKAWKSLIDTSHFTTRYVCHLHHLLVTHHHFHHINPGFGKYISIPENDHTLTFPQQKVVPILPELVNMLESSRVIGCSHGLLCLHGYRNFTLGLGDRARLKNMVVLWNISMAKAVGVVVPSVVYGYRNVFGFGVCRECNVAKVVNIKLFDFERNKEVVSFVRWEVDVFSLSTGTWRRLDDDHNIPRKSIKLFGSLVVIDEFLYWLGMDMSNGYHRSYNMIVSFDVTKEEFREVNLPDSLARDQSDENLSISKIRESLVVLECEGVADNPSFVVWMMEGGISESFTKLFTIYIPDALISSVLGFRKNGEPILELSKRCDDSSNDSTLVVYEPCTKLIRNIGIDGRDQLFNVSSYMETLQLYDQPDSIIYYKGRRFYLKQSGPEELL